MRYEAQARTGFYKVLRIPGLVTPKAKIRSHEHRSASQNPHKHEPQECLRRKATEPVIEAGHDEMICTKAADEGLSPLGRRDARWRMEGANQLCRVPIERKHNGRPPGIPSILYRLSNQLLMPKMDAVENTDRYRGLCKG